jgi:hypothetical protein
MDNPLVKSMQDFIRANPDAAKQLRDLVQQKLVEFGSIERIDITARNVGLQASSQKIAYEMFQDFFLELGVDVPKKIKPESMR